MQIAYPLFEKPIELEENTVNVLVIENPRAFYAFSQELLCAMQNAQSSLVLSKNFESLSLAKYADVVFATEQLELNNKKVLQRLYKNLKQNAYHEELYLHTANLQSNIMQYVQMLCDTESLPLVFGEIEIESMLKILDVKLEPTSNTLAEKICAYIDTVSTYLGVHLFFFFHLKSYLSENELQSIYQHCFYQKEQLILCESNARPLLKNEKMHLIDYDLCQVT